MAIIYETPVKGYTTLRTAKRCTREYTGKTHEYAGVWIYCTVCGASSRVTAYHNGRGGRPEAIPSVFIANHRH